MIVEEQPPVGARDVGCDDDVAGAAEFQKHVAGIGEARRQRRGHVVGGAADTGSPSGRPVSAAAAAVTFPNTQCEMCFGRERVAATWVSATRSSRIA